MIDLFNLLDQFPSHFKENDTYKDSSGKGILERYLYVLGEYFANQVVPEIDNILDLIDVDTTPYPYTAFLWEFLGSLPYASGLNSKYDATVDITTQEYWNNMLGELPVADYRNLLKYAISLYKIRGTLDFYNILLRFYGLIKVDVDDPNGSLENPVGDNLNPEDYIAYYDSDYLYDSGEQYDITLNCIDCTPVNISVHYDWYTINDEVKNRILLILNRFRPVDVEEFTLENVEFIPGDLRIFIEPENLEVPPDVTISQQVSVTFNQDDLPWRVISDDEE